MSKQDRQGVRTPMQLEQKYDLGAYERNDKSYAQLESQTNQLNQTLAQFMAETNGKIAELEEENTTTFFGSGVPTLDNYPASDWTSDELKNMHIGNMYQDEDTDYTYLFKCTDGVYEWVQCKSEGSGGGDIPSGDITVSDITDLTVSAEELNHLEGVTSNVQEQINQLTEDTSSVQEQLDDKVENLSDLGITMSAAEINKLKNIGTYIHTSGSGISITAGTLTRLGGIKASISGLYLVQIVICPSTGTDGRIRVQFRDQYREVRGVPHTNVNHTIDFLTTLTAGTEYGAFLFLSGANTVSYSINGVLLREL